MEPANCGVDDAKCTLSYDRDTPELKDSKDKDFSFEIQRSGDGRSIGVFQIRKDHEVLRQNTSKPFQDGALTKKSMKVNKYVCVVTVKKHNNVMPMNLHDYFD